MKNKTYKSKEWALMIAAAILIVAGVFALLGLSLYISLHGQGPVSLHGPGARKAALVLFGCGAGAGIVLCGASAAAASRCRKLLKVWDGDESQGLDKLEKRMDILNYLFEGCFVVLLLTAGFFVFVWAGKAPEGTVWPLGAVCVFVFIFGSIVLRGFQKNIQDEMNRLLEAGEGYVYSSSFYGKESLNQWMKNTDEGQRQLVYKAAFRVYRNTTCILFSSMNLALVFIAFRSTTGFTVFLTIGVIWILMSASFCIERNRLRKQRIR